MANTKNNARKRASKQKIAQAFMDEFREQGEVLERVTVSAVCSRAHLNRSTFYASYRDVRDLAERICAELREQVAELYREEHERGFNSNDYLKIFKHMYAHQDLYHLCFALGVGSVADVEYDTERAKRDFGSRHIDYHIEFFRAGLNAMVGKWLGGGCKESPEEMEQILRDEYRHRQG